jgi:hypothetical protein
MKSTENPYAGQGPVLLDVGGDVLLDVGGDVGALLVKMPPSWEGVEVELRPEQPAPDLHSHDHTDHSRSLDDEDHAHLRHVEVLPRLLPPGSCAVRSSLSSLRDDTNCTSGQTVRSGYGSASTVARSLRRAGPRRTPRVGSHKGLSAATSARPHAPTLSARARSRAVPLTDLASGV